MERANHNRPRFGLVAANVNARRLVAGLLLLVAATACSANSDPNTVGLGGLRVWVGELADTDVDVGIVASSTQSTLFFCGGSSSFRDHTHWFIGAGRLVEGTRIEGGDWHVSISSTHGQVVGTLEIDGLEPVSFSAEAVASGAVAGLYDAFAPCGHAGLIVRQPAAGNVPMTQGACLQSDAGFTNVEQVSPVMPVTHGAGPEIFAELTNDPSQQFTLRPRSLEGT